MCRQQRYIRAACAPARPERPGGGTPLAAVERAVTFAAAAAASPGSAVDGLDDSGPVALADGDGRSGPAALSGVGGGTDPESRGAVKGGGDGVKGEGGGDAGASWSRARRRRAPELAAWDAKASHA